MLKQNLQDYLYEMVEKRTPFFQEIEQFAKNNKVPIMDTYSMDVVLQLLRLTQPKSILEIGTAIGYSALRMSTVTDAKIVTVERDEKRIENAKEFIKRAEKFEQILLLEGDAFDLIESIHTLAPFDVIFIDAAKGQYQRFFEAYEPLLTSNGLIITDNVLFKGYVYGSGPEPNKRLEKLGEKIHRYNKWLIDHPGFTTTILPVGDGIAISKRR